MLLASALVLTTSIVIAAADTARPSIEPVPFTAVRITDAFWAPRIETNRTVTIPACFRQCEETGRIANFDAAAAALAGREGPSFKGNCYDDSDVYKVIEGAAYALAQHPDPALDAYLDALIARIAAAQEPDGYLYTIATAGRRGPDARWKDERWSHETYCAGHLIEAAVAHHQATGKRSLLDVAVRFADLLVATYLPGATAAPRSEVPGHQGIEIALVRLHRVTQEAAPPGSGSSKYLDLARHFLVRRGDAAGRELYGDYCQDHAPLVEQRTAVGHAVRAGYLYTAMADVASVTGEATFDAALDAIWRDTVGTKMHITGGIGAHAHNEGFGDAYDLPNESAYLETCAAIANALWNHRMFLRSGSSEPIDVLERTLHNGMLAGVGLSGDRFFYPNPLAADGMRRFNHGTNGRAAWFGCACCPVNIARFIPSISGMVYATGSSTIYANLFIQSEATVALDGISVGIDQTTAYPYDGRVSMRIRPSEPREFTLAVRIPGWVRSRPVPGELYRPVASSGVQVGGMWVVAVNGQPLVPPPMRDGYALLTRRWKAGDEVTLALPMSVRRMESDARIVANRGRVALERGPLVYAVEAVDAGGSVRDLVVPDTARIAIEMRDGPAPGVPALIISGERVTTDGASETRFAAIPYALWANRPGPQGVGEMAVWLPRGRELAEPKPAPTVASRASVRASHTWDSDTEFAVNDRRLPSSNADTTIPRHTFWPRKGSVETIEYAWSEPVTLDGAEVHFFDDTSVGGGCALPASWRLLARGAGSASDGEGWTPIDAEFVVNGEGPSAVRFAPMAVTGLRLEMTLAPERSAGVLEWSVREADAKR